MKRTWVGYRLKVSRMLGGLVNRQWDVGMWKEVMSSLLLSENIICYMGCEAINEEENRMTVS